MKQMIPDKFVSMLDMNAQKFGFVKMGLVHPSVVHRLRMATTYGMTQQLGERTQRSSWAT